MIPVAFWSAEAVSADMDSVRCVCNLIFGRKPTPLIHAGLNKGQLKIKTFHLTEITTNKTTKDVTGEKSVTHDRQGADSQVQKVL